MTDKLSFQHTFHALERAIGITQKRNSVIASNISNLDTPRYKGKDIDFRAALAQAVNPDHNLNLVRTNPGHIDPRANPAQKVEPFEEEGEWNGFNWVDIDNEMGKLIENNLIYRTTLETLLRKITILRDVIREGGR